MDEIVFIAPENGFLLERHNGTFYQTDPSQSCSDDQLGFFRVDYIAFATDTETRAERVERQKPVIDAQYNDRQREFIDFVLAQYVGEGVGELSISKLPDLIELKYQSTHDAVQVLGSVRNIREVFIGFQQGLYAPSPDENH